MKISYFELGGSGGVMCEVGRIERVERRSGTAKGKVDPQRSSNDGEYVDEEDSRDEMHKVRELLSTSSRRS